MLINPHDPLSSLAFGRPREDWHHRHNAAVFSATALPVMKLLRAIAAFTKDAGDTDTYLNERILAPLLAAAHEALNTERGHLDGGRCSEWLDSIAEARGIAA